MTETQIILAAIKAQTAKPAKAIVNSEAAFVQDRLQDQGYLELSKQYWRWVCTQKKVGGIFTEEVSEAQAVLDSLNSKSVMPSWGTYGT
jgi:hypothetical protein